MLTVTKVEYNFFGENTYLVVDQDTRKAVVVDPGMLNESERNDFYARVSRMGVELIQIVNTHMHLDHCFGANYVRDRYGVKVAASMLDADLGRNLAGQLRLFGARGGLDPVEIDVNLNDGDIIEIGNSHLFVIVTPGHSPGGICLYSKEDGFLLSGDTLFRSGIGRTDLPGGDYATLARSIRNRLFDLPEDTVVYPGHGPETTIGIERRTNNYV